jgi:ribosomal protein S12 methylthiotransferase
MGTFHLLTLGCPKNVVDSEDLQSTLFSEGFSPVDDPELADFMLINTCGFIDDAKKESIHEILTISETKGARQELIVFGCLAQRYREEMERELPEVDAFFGVEHHQDIVNYCKGATCHSKVHIPAIEVGKSYTYLKIAEGCDRPCSFCSIPHIRGKFRSIQPDIILANAERSIRSGVHELILVAQDATSYGRDLNGYGLHELINDICSISGEFWLRLLYLYPTAIDEGLLEIMAENEKVSNYIDIPLQHSEDRIIRLMKRGGSRKSYLNLIEGIRQVIPDIVLRTTFIVGFPSETEDEFHGLLDFVEECNFDRMGAFPYSREEGTLAYGYGKHVSRKTKEYRHDQLMRQQAEISFRKNQAMIGRTISVIVDETHKDLALCRYRGQAPEIDGITFVNIGDQRCSPGDLIDVTITEVNDYDLRAEPASNNFR